MTTPATVTVCHVSFYFCEGRMKVTFMPLDTLYLAARLRHAGFAVDFRDYQIRSKRYEDPQDPEGFATTFLRDAGDIVVATCTNEALPLAICGLAILKEIDPAKRIILGGIGAAGCADEIVRAFPAIDYVVAVDLRPRKIRNAEQIYVDLVDAIASGAGPAERVIRPAMPAVRKAEDETNEALLPAYDLVNLSHYNEVVMRTAWGCPFLCTYCDRHRDRTVVWRRLERVFEELTLLQTNYRRKRVFFYDETFTLSKKRTLDFCRQLVDGFSPVKWSCTSRVDTLDGELAQAMAEAGCTLVYMGVESGSDTVLERVRKGYRREKAEETVKLALDHMDVGSFFVWGFPFESVKDFEQTVDLIEQFQSWKVYPTLYSFSALPGSDAYGDVRAMLRFDDDWWEANWPAHFPHSRGREKLKTLIQDHPMVFPGFYTSDPLIREKLKLIQDRGWRSHFPD